MARASASLLFLPIVTLFLGVLRCDGWGGAAVECWQGAHLALALACLALLPPFLALALFTAAVFVNRQLDGGAADAKRHGRVHAAVLLVKALLALYFALLAGVDDWLALCVLLAAGLAQLGLFLHEMPFVSLAANATHVAFAAGFLWAVFGLFLALADSAFDAGVFVVAGLPAALALGALGAHFRAARVAARPLAELRSVVEYDLWARDRLARLARSGARAKLGQARAKDDGAGEDQALLDDAQALLRSAEEAFRLMLERHPESGFARILASSFYQAFHESHSMELTVLSQAGRCSSAIDVRFLIYQRTRQLQESTASGGSRMSPIDRIIYDQHWNSAIGLQTLCYRNMRELWQHLLERTPDLAVLQRIGESVRRDVARAEGHFLAMLRLNPEAPSLLRAYSHFLTNLINNPARGQELANKADRVEEAQQRSRSTKLAHFQLGQVSQDVGFMDEQNAMITVSGDVARIGEIISVNLAACRMFGRSRTEMIGQNINIIVPRPFSDVHDSYMLHFVRTGRGMGMMNTTRTMLALHAQGHLFPIRINFRESPPTTDDPAPRFTAFMQSVTTDEEYVLFGNDDNNYVVYGASERSYSLLAQAPLSEGGSPHDSAYHASDWFPGITDPDADAEAEEELNQHQTVTASIQSEVDQDGLG